MNRRYGIGLAVAITLAGANAAADPDPVTPTLTSPLHIHSPSNVHTDGGTDLRLPPGYFLSEPQWDSLDTAKKTDQDTITRLGAENNSLKSTLSGWSPGWRTLIVTFVTGVALGVYLERKL